MMVENLVAIAYWLLCVEYRVFNKYQIMNLKDHFIVLTSAFKYAVYRRRASKFRE